MVLIAGVHAIDNERGVHGTFHLLIGYCTVIAAYKRLLGLDLPQCVLKRRCLHVMKNTLLADAS